VPNPDYGSTMKDAVAPKKETITVFHRNAKRLEDAKLAAPYDVTFGPWTVSDSNVIGTSGIDTTKRL
jgi:hypothetical protein